ncbi:hypothetical protein [Sinomonas sp. P10A9]|uniref:Secreted protein n=1 Tax=Sinomonas puerhi TaxID=3238584 RepID=A0AB39L7Q2_9MICC
MRTRRLVAAAVSAAALMSSVLLAPAAQADDHGAPAPEGGATTVVLNPTLVPVLVNALKVRAIAPGELSAPAGVAQVAFPITDVEDGVIEHSGGLEFTPLGGGDLRLTRFDINLSTGLLDAKGVLNGNRLPGRVDLFALGAVRPINGHIPACAGTAAGLTLTSTAAQALGAPAFAGAFIGDACVVPGQDD